MLSHVDVVVVVVVPEMTGTEPAWNLRRKVIAPIRY